MSTSSSPGSPLRDATKASQLTWIHPQQWLAPMPTGQQSYWIQFPGPNANAPAYLAFKGIPNDSSCMPPPSQTTNIGSYASLSAAMAACASDAFPPTKAVIYSIQTAPST